MDTPRRRNRRIVLGIIVIALIVGASLPIYYFLFRVPPMDEFLATVYKEGDRAAFRVHVTDHELLETSYGTVTLVRFDEVWPPFAFFGDRRNSYPIGERCTTEVAFHRYEIDNESVVLPQEYLLGFYLSMEPTFHRISLHAGMGLEGAAYDAANATYEVEVKAFEYTNNTFAKDQYDHALNRNRLPERWVQFYRERAEDGFAGAARPLLITHYIVLSNMVAFGADSSAQRERDTFLPDRVALTDPDEDGRLSVGDRIAVELGPTRDRYTFETYKLSLNGILSGYCPILNWHAGPFYSIGGQSGYTLGWSEVRGREPNGTTIEQLTVHRTWGAPAPMSETEVQLYKMREHVLTLMTLTDKTITTFTDDGTDAEVSFADTNDNGQIDGGDRFELNGLELYQTYEVRVIHRDRTRLSWEFVPSLGLQRARWPVLMFAPPEHINDHITLALDRVEAYFPRLGDLQFELWVPTVNVTLVLDRLNALFADATGEETEVHPSRTVGAATLNLTIVDTDENGYYTPQDRIVIRGLDEGDPYRLTVRFTGQTVSNIAIGTLSGPNDEPARRSDHEA